MRIEVTNIEWCVEEEDVEDTVCSLGVYDSEEEYQREIDAEIDKILEKLPTSVIYDFDDEYTIEEIDDHIEDMLSDEYGWLVYGFDYKVLD